MSRNAINIMLSVKEAKRRARPMRMATWERSESRAVEEWHWSLLRGSLAIDDGKGEAGESYDYR
jgi:hypothetical protein